MIPLVLKNNEPVALPINRDTNDGESIFIEGEDLSVSPNPVTDN